MSASHIKAFKPQDLPEADRTRFWSKVSIGTPDQCWEWQSVRNRQGYGLFWFNGRKYTASRVSIALHDGAEIGRATLACHRCDNPCCVNPGHLFRGTTTDNMLDASDKGRISQQKRTHCPYGHEFNEKNTKWVLYPPSGRMIRRCRACENQYNSVWKKAKRARLAAACAAQQAKGKQGEAK